ncbi:dual specificity [Echinococcus multilocularis]|uniref:Gaba permease n=1 Tax=Echinococcus multilocularis TaxID=6211 RepID=A0A0S4MM48_ECHMU|nr:dual specificity [Echinococcus multilocularis]
MLKSEAGSLAGRNHTVCGYSLLNSSEPHGLDSNSKATCLTGCDSGVKNLNLDLDFAQEELTIPLSKSLFVTKGLHLRYPNWRHDLSEYKHRHAINATVSLGATSSIWLVWGFPSLEFAGTGAVYVNWHSEPYHGKWRHVHIQRDIPALFTESAKDMHIIDTAAMLRRTLVIRCTLILLESLKSRFKVALTTLT